MPNPPSPNQLLEPFLIVPIPGIKTRIRRMKQHNNIRLLLSFIKLISILEIINIKNNPIIKNILWDFTNLYGSLNLYSAQILLAEYIITIPNIANIIVHNNNILSIFIFIIYLIIYSKYKKNAIIVLVNIMENIDVMLAKLAKSKFRSSFKLRKYMYPYINEKGIDIIRKHAYDFISKRIAPSEIKNDGKQTPTKGHPVFIAQHACAICCRGCLEKWYHIPYGKELTEEEINYFVDLIMKWIEKEYN